jgi:hypothetical protein
LIYLGLSLWQYLISTVISMRMFSVAGTEVPNSKMYTGSKTVSGGVAVFYMTDNGAANGNALFSAITSVQPVVNDSTTVYACSWVISGDLKTLTLTVNKSATPLLSLLGLNILAQPTAAPNGTVAQVLVVGS